MHSLSPTAMIIKVANNPNQRIIKSNSNPTKSFDNAWMENILHVQWKDFNLVIFICGNYKIAFSFGICCRLCQCNWVLIRHAFDDESAGIVSLKFSEILWLISRESSSIIVDFFLRNIVKLLQNNLKFHKSL